MAYVELANIVISASQPTNPGTDWTRFAWIDTASRQIKEFEDGVWVAVATFTDIIELPEDLKLTTLTVEGDAQFNRLIKLGDMEGQTAEIKTEGGTLVFKNGILVKYG